MRRTDPAGATFPADAFVFGNAIGQRVGNFKRAWQTAVLKAHGAPATCTETANLTPETRAALRRIDLHFHDLRREAGSRWLDKGVPLHVIQTWLGHANVSQTSTYLAVRDDGSDREMARLDALQVTKAEAAAEAAEESAESQPATSAGESCKNLANDEAEIGGPEPRQLEPVERLVAAVGQPSRRRLSRGVHTVRALFTKGHVARVLHV